jgi:hypothetical protein
MSQQLILRSVDAIPGVMPLGQPTSSANFKLQLPNNTITGDYAITEVSLGNQVYNLNTLNNILIYTDTSQRTVPIPPGFYTMATLVPIIATLMSTASSVTYTGTVDPNSSIVSISGPAAFTLNFGTFPGKYLPQSPFATLASILGFPNTDVASVGNALTGTNPGNLNWNTAYYITIATKNNSGARSEFAKPGGNYCTLTVLINVNANTTIVYRPLALVRISLTNVNEMTIHVRDDTGNLIQPLGSLTTILLEKIDKPIGCKCGN